MGYYHLVPKSSTKILLSSRLQMKQSIKGVKGGSHDQKERQCPPPHQARGGITQSPSLAVTLTGSRNMV